MNVLVIGGAGYIGSHCVRQLIAAGHKPVVLDNLVYGHKGALLPSVKFYLGNLEDKKLVGEILDNAGSMEAFANRHQAFPGDPTKFDPNRPQSALFKDVDDKIRKKVEVVETPHEDA